MQYELSQHEVSTEHNTEPVRMLPEEQKPQRPSRPTKIRPLLTLCSTQLLNIGPDFSTFLPTALCFVVLLQSVTFLIYTSNKSADIIKTSTLILNLVQNLSLILCGLINPGVATCNQRQTSIDEQLFLCSVCKIYRRPSTHHCSECNACIKGFDHHCAFIGKCVGRGNFALFCIFVFSTFGAIFYNLFVLILLVANTQPQ